MGDTKVFLTTGGEIATTTAIRTLLQWVAGATRDSEIRGFGISFSDAAAGNAKVLVELLYQTTAGTMSAQSVVVESGITLAVPPTGQKTATAEPAAGGIVRQYLIDPSTGYTEFPTDPIPVPAGTRLGIRVTSAANWNAVAWFDGVG